MQSMSTSRIPHKSITFLTSHDQHTTPYVCLTFLPYVPPFHLHWLSLHDLPPSLSEVFSLDPSAPLSYRPGSIKEERRYTAHPRWKLMWLWISYSAMLVFAANGSVERKCGWTGQEMDGNARNNRHG